MEIVDKISYAIEDGLFNLIEKIERKRYKIKFNQELVEVINEEAIKLGLDTNKIKFATALPYRHDIVSSGKSEDFYYIILDTDGSRNRGTIRHELYHIYRGDCDKGVSIKTSPFYYLFIAEPRAMIYEYFKIKI